ncbi:hypothetical protein NM688_g342 [Phlebia brevispora]|uniref:Uncharacterized protein n=1 Tax=Phlebia brevispora TaxID=194682 RepID=A0ACC1TE92_9APHY|nr:hypothetical protein NM688_g342 [Phlebia brevispora]
MRDIAQDVIYHVAEAMSAPEDLKTFSLVSRIFLVPSQTILFRDIQVRFDRTQGSILAFKKFIDDHKRFANYIHSLHLRGNRVADYPRANITLEGLWQLIILLPVLKALTLERFEWLPSPMSTSGSYRHPALHSISLQHIYANSYDESPLQVLCLVPCWERVHIFDIWHRIVVPTLWCSPFVTNTLIFDNCPYYSAKRSLVSHDHGACFGIRALAI